MQVDGGRRSSVRSGAEAPPPASLERAGDHWVGRFVAMASPCEVLVDGDDRVSAAAALEVARDEALRIERKFSRYRDDSVVHAIHQAAGAPVEVDEETRGLLDYAAVCHELSGGRFDITSGVLRRVWTFDGCAHVPDRTAIEQALRHVGWTRVDWDGHAITLPAGMEIDFGGIGKEYAVDRAAALVAGRIEGSFVVNFGGDLFASRPRGGGRPWSVGIDDPERTGDQVLYRVDLSRGGLATSGDARRYVMVEGRRLGHVLDPRTGWPVEQAPRSVTVVAGTCLEAGTLSTLACLRGPGAEAFLEQQGVQFRVVR